MGFILVPEVTDGGQYRIGSCSAQGAERAVFNSLAQFQQQLDVSFTAIAKTLL
jgi:hypothetical protein